MPLIASNIVFAPPPPPPEVKSQIVISGGDWRNQIAKQIAKQSEPIPVEAPVDDFEPITMPKLKKSRKKSEKLIEYKESSFMSDMLSINKE